MDFDDVLEELGEFGPYQITTYLLICLPVFFTAANSLSYVFIAGVPNYRCFVPNCDNASSPIYNLPWVEEAIPPERPNETYRPAFCSMYSTCDNFTGVNECPVGYFSNDTVTCDQWVFDDEWTIVGEFNITCQENQWKLSLVGTVQFAAIFVGTVGFGYLADRIGRKKVMVSCTLVMFFSGVAKVISPNYISFLIFSFVNSLGISGTYLQAYIIGVELVGRKKREMSAIVLNYFFAFGEASVALIAWLFKDWVVLQLAVSVPCAFFVVYYWILPESVRWLLAHGKDKEAFNIIKKAAKVNRVVLSKKLLDTYTNFGGRDNKEEPGATISGPNVKIMGIGSSALEIMKSRSLCLRSFNLFFTWSSIAFVYYGLSLSATNLGGDKYLNFALVSLIEIPGYTLAWYCLGHFGRKHSLFGSLLLCAVTCVGAALVPTGVTWAETMLFLTGKLAITCSFGTIYVFTAELYPTVMRGAGVGISSTVGRIGAMIAPFVSLLGTYNNTYPLYLFGTIALTASLLSLLYPETRGVKLPETLDDVKRLK